MSFKISDFEMIYISENNIFYLPNNNLQVIAEFIFKTNLFCKLIIMRVSSKSLCKRK